MTEPKTEHTTQSTTQTHADPSILCESCGYDISGLPETAACSECGRSVRLSLPERRVGSAFQNGPSPASLAATAWATLRHPKPLFDVIRIDRKSSRRLLLINVAIAAALLSIGPWTDLMRAFLREIWISWPLNFAISAAALLVLTQIETIGIRSFGKRRGWRVTRDVALAVAAHASVGWVVMGVLFLAAVMLQLPPSLRWQPSIAGLRVSATAIAPPIFALLIGLFLFELLVYLGVQRCRFANPPRPQDPR